MEVTMKYMDQYIPVLLMNENLQLYFHGPVQPNLEIQDKSQITHVPARKFQ